MAIPRRKKFIRISVLLGCLAPILGCGAKNAEVPIRVKIDPRVELMSLIFRLAGNPEYRQGRIESYERDVIEHFSAFKDHDVVKLASKLRETRGVSYDAVMGMAVHITDAESLKERIPFDPQPETLDARWTPEAARSFLQEARRFVADSKFKEFLQSHTRIYNLATARMQAVLEEQRVTDWFDGFFGARPGAKFEIILGMLNGPANYGAWIKPSKEDEILYCILGIWGADDQGNPHFSRQDIPTAVHEFCHSYCNPLVDRHAPELQTSGIEIFKRVKAAMSRMAYGNWLIMIRESLVRASVIRFLHAKFGEEAAEKGIQSENKRKFFWIGELSNLLGEYEQTRTEYPTLDDFFPKIIEFFDTYADRIDQDVETMEKERQAVGRDASRQQFPGNGRKRLLRQNTQGVHYSGQTKARHGR